MPLDVLTFLELCLFAGLSVNSARKLLKRLGITGERKGGALLFTRAEADRVKAAWQERAALISDSQD